MQMETNLTRSQNLEKIDTRLFAFLAFCFLLFHFHFFPERALIYDHILAGTSRSKLCLLTRSIFYDTFLWNCNIRQPFVSRLAWLQPDHDEDDAVSIPLKT